MGVGKGVMVGEDVGVEVEFELDPEFVAGVGVKVGVVFGEGDKLGFGEGVA